MKRITSIAFFALASLLTVGNLPAQDVVVQATIPFAFRVGNTSLPAGTYRITSSTTSDSVITIRNREKLDVAALSITRPADSKDDADGKLVFNRYGGQYFLSQILCPWKMSVELPTSKTEQRAKQREASLEQNHQVLLALK